ncbi:MAG: phosphotransferase family protein [Rhodospirillaceae bacterium]|jgi:aminoglycoside phosphotransferase (APT) family kinase protein|nr:phosphotransferase family protein [Rhodospirillaceae bacterium]MBT4690596.1 phosphotransferase family protein [Rhodospirillaceae bacterium]MBT5083854.1 phosphotransferase family protein [Rhodospirillaceae bacterium]MBT5526291.1 phosphotransferase family protein [Rhodospirillaceae bacterium]MBT5879839.1 phosphotransferase family protein [Rhodospirillaceae bacterium]
MDPQTTEPEGYDVPAVEAWIAGNVSDLTPPFKWTRLQGGHSNLTYRIDDTQGRAAVIRRPPQGVLLPKAHDMGREWALISCLGPTPVPVAPAMGFCEDPKVTGAWFYVMGLIDGRPLYSTADTEAVVPMENRQTMARSFIDVLADLHSLDPDDIGLGDLGKKEDYVGRQLRTWFRSWTSSIDDAEYDDPRAHELQDYFSRNIPDQGPARVVHGDYGLHNCLIGSGGHVTAVVDWEISTLGDPLADLAYALNQWADPGDWRHEAPTNLPGFPMKAELAARYAARSGRDLSMLEYYVGFNWWKTACIVHGVYARYCAGKKSAVGADLDNLRMRIGKALDLSSEAVANIRN